MLPAPGTPDPFVSAVTSFSGSLLAPLGPVTLTVDSVVIYDGTQDPQTTIAGCPLVGTAFNFHGQLNVNALQTTATNSGSNVAVTTTATFVDPTTGTPRSADVAVTFAT